MVQAASEAHKSAAAPDWHGARTKCCNEKKRGKVIPYAGNKTPTYFCPSCNSTRHGKGLEAEGVCAHCRYAGTIQIKANRIGASDVEGAVWHYLRRMRYKDYLLDVVKKRLLAGFRKSDTSGYKIAEVADVNKQFDLMSMALLQAEEYYRYARGASMAVAPVLYFYGMINLVKTLLAATYTVSSYIDDIRGHGISNTGGLDLSDEISFQTKGEFQGFFKCASASAETQLEKLPTEGGHRTITISQLLDRKLASNEPLHWPESVRLYLLMFKLSSICRYEPEMWRHFMSGRGGEGSYRYEDVIHQCRIYFPRDILILISGESYHFAPLSVMEGRYDAYQMF